MNARSSSFLACALLLTAPAVAQVSVPEDLECGTPEGAQAGPGELPVPEDPVKALMVCITFPNIIASGDGGIPSWLIEMAGDGAEGTFEAYMRKLSEGRHILDITFEYGSGGEPWVASMNDFDYAPSQGQVVNREILQAIQSAHTEHPDYLSQFDVAFIVYNGNPYGPNLGGIASLGFLDFPTAFSGRGYSARMIQPGANIDGDFNRRYSELVQVHEYGHLLGLSHTPQPFDNGCAVKKLGMYSPMHASVPVDSERGYRPYHILNLIRLGWFDRVVEQTGPIVLRDCRRGGDAIKIPIAEFSQGSEYYLVMNHQGSDFDADYLGTGLLIWHVREETAEPTIVDLWDLEVASGLFDSQDNPDPVAGTDSLDDTFKGMAGDFWTSGSFGPSSNPNTNGYQPLVCPVQNAPTGIAVENITQVGTDMHFEVVPAFAPSVLSATIVPAAETFLGLDCDAAHVFSLPIFANVLGADGQPLAGIPNGWMKFRLHSLSPTLEICLDTEMTALTDTGSAGETDTRFYHACGGGELYATMEVFGRPVGASLPAKVRTPDLNADQVVDGDDVTAFGVPFPGPPEDDIRDFNFDLSADVSDLAMLAGQLDTELEPDVTIEFLNPLDGAEIPIGSTLQVQVDSCSSDGAEGYLMFVERSGTTAIAIGQGGIDYAYHVLPPVETSTLLARVLLAALGQPSTSIVVDFVAPDVDIVKRNTTPLGLNTPGQIGTVRFRIVNQEALDLSLLDVHLSFPNGDLAVVSGPTPAAPYTLVAGAQKDLSWTVQRISGTGAATAVVDVGILGHPEVLVSESFSVFRVTTGGGF